MATRHQYSNEMTFQTCKGERTFTDIKKGQMWLRLHCKKCKTCLTWKQREVTTIDTTARHNAQNEIENAENRGRETAYEYGLLFRNI